MKTSLKIRKKADQKSAAENGGAIKASEFCARIARMQRILNGLNEEAKRLGSCRVEPDN
jgi:hypothetical protein